MGYEEDYCRYVDFPHFETRAQWIKDYHDGMDGNILEVGSGYGFLIKHLNDLGLVGKVDGLEPDSYPFSKVSEVGVSQYVYNEYVQGHNWTLTPNLDLIVSWNVLDCMPNEATAENVVSILNTKATYQVHIICVYLENSTTTDNYIDEGVFIKPIQYWKDLFTSDGTILVEYDTRKVWARRSGVWVEETDWNIPLSWRLVSQ